MKSTQTTQAGEAAEPPDDPDCNPAPAIPDPSESNEETPERLSPAQRDSSRRSALLEAIYYSVHSR